MPIKICENCEIGFKTRKTTQRFCSVTCGHALQIGTRRPTTSAKMKAFYSSHPGFAETKANSTSFKPGHSVPSEWTESQRKKVTGLRHNPEMREKISLNTKAFFFEHPEVRERLSQIHRGEKHWNWKGDRTPELHRLRNTPQYDQWRASVYSRDGWTCRDCGSKEDLTAHHILSFNDFPEFRFDVQNGITLCRSCHKIDHEEIGAETRFNSREDFITDLLVRQGQGFQHQVEWKGIAP